MSVSIIVAASENHVIGKDNKLIWHLPADLKYFKNLTMGHTMIMGRKTFDSIGRPLPGRTTVIVTRQKDYKRDDCIVVNSLEEAIERTKSEEEVFIIGGAEIFNQSTEIADTIYLTKIHHTFEGDTFFPEPDPDEWGLTDKEDHFKDDKNPFDYSFCIFRRKV